ncbi:MAG TPA: MFS transporter, partial [Tepidisphaeraceae bacterium]|nr:MFS transporter [Tepidisphaeraceae bacterium]
MAASNWKVNLAVLWLAETLNLIAFSFVLPFMPLYIQTMGVKGDAEATTWAATITAMAAVAAAICQPIWGNMADRHGRRPMVIRSMIGACVTSAMMGLAPTP